MIERKMLQLLLRELQGFSELCARYQGTNIYFLLYTNITPGDLSISIWKKHTLLTAYIYIVFCLCGNTIV